MESLIIIYLRLREGGKPSFSGKQVAIKIYVNLRLAQSGFEQLGPV